LLSFIFPFRGFSRTYGRFKYFFSPRRIARLGPANRRASGAALGRQGEPRQLFNHT